MKSFPLPASPVASPTPPMGRLPVPDAGSHPSPDHPLRVRARLPFLVVVLLLGAGACALAQAPTAGVFYREDFSGGAGPEWSRRVVARAPADDRAFLGRFGNETATLTLTQLPPHTNLVVSLELLTLQSWDGNQTPGPDLWEVQRGDDGALLLHTSFSNQHFTGRHQSFPANHPQGRFPAFTGASEAGTLGYSTSDGVYPLRFVFPHTDSQIVLHFAASGLQALSDESWGLAHVTIGSGNPPQVALLQPNPQPGLAAPATLRLEAAVEDADNDLARVEFLANGILLGSVDRPPYTLVWSNAPAGFHPLTARAVDRLGLSATASTNLVINGLRAEYFNNSDLTQLRVTRQDPRVDFAWENRVPVPVGLADAYYSVRWTGYVDPPFPEDYRLDIRVDDGGRLWVDGRRVIDAWYGQSPTTHSASVPLEGGRRHFIQMEYNNTGCCGAEARLRWQSASQTNQAIPQSQLSPFEAGLNRPPNTPVLVEPRQDGQQLDPRHLALAVDYFSDPNTGDTHLRSDWEIWTTTPPERVWQATGISGTGRLRLLVTEGTFEGSHAGRTRLRDASAYRVRTRHQDNSDLPGSDWSDWAEREFRTLAEEEFAGPGEVTVTVPGWADPWLAGLPDGSRASTTDVAPDQSPVPVPGLLLEPGTLLAFRASGTTRHGSAQPFSGPDGGANVAHRGGAENGLSGLTAPVCSLVAIFLGPDRPDLSAPPPSLGFNSAASLDYRTFSPVLGQPFFVGDGETAAGESQRIVVPRGATRLYLGTMDGYQWVGNGGLLEVTVSSAAWSGDRNLVANGSFEFPGFETDPGYRFLDSGDTRVASWVVCDDGTGDRPFWNKINHRAERVFDGRYAVVLNQGSCLRTTIPVSSNRAYEVSFSLRAEINSDRRLEPLRVTAGDLDVHFPPVATWIRHAFSFTARSNDPALLLEFANPSPEGDYRAYDLDAVSVVERPEIHPAGPRRLSIEGTVGRTYRVEFTPTLASPIPWLEIGRIPLLASPQEFPDPRPDPSPAGFYRLLEVP